MGTKLANQLGLYDCSGNIWEWCYDTNNSGYISEENPYIYDISQGSRRIRGGAWENSVSASTIVYRNSDSSSSRSYYYGFRFVRTI